MPVEEDLAWEFFWKHQVIISYVTLASQVNIGLCAEHGCSAFVDSL